jgi:hypothetical protein
MNIKYDATISVDAIENDLKRLTNQIYKLLPLREEDSDWEKPLETILEEFAGMSRLLIDQHDVIFIILCKLEGLFTLTKADDFLLYRRTIFECLSYVNKLKLCLD